MDEEVLIIFNYLQRAIFREAIIGFINLEKFAAKYPQIYEKITGKGLLIGMHFKTPKIGYKVAAELFKRNVVVAGTLTSAQTIRVEPPLIVTQEQMDTLLDRLGEVLKEVSTAM